MGRSARLLLLSGCVILTAVACQSAPRQSGRLIETVEGPTFTEREARSRLFGFVRVFAGEVEAAADAIADLAGEDIPLFESALVWKTQAVFACLGAATDPDPLVGLLDTAALVTQMRMYFESGIGADRFGQHQELALAAARSLEDRMRTLMEELGGPEQAARTWGDVEEWSAENPLRDHYFTRESTVALLRILTTAPGGSVWTALSGAEETIDDLTERMALLTELLPRTVRWQAGLLLVRTVEFTRIRETFGELQAMSVRLRAALADLQPVLRGERQLTVEAGLTERALAQVDAQAEVVMEKLRAERGILLDTVQQQLDEFLQAVRAEREAVLGEIDRQRVDTVAAVSAERQEILDRIARELDDALAATDDLAARRLEGAARDARAIVDGALERAFRHALVLLGAGFFGGVLLVLLARRRRAA